MADTAAGVAPAASGIGPGFADYPTEAQAVFRALLDAMARPGTVAEVSPPAAAPEPLDGATAAAALCLFDHETPIWLGDGIAGMQVYEYLRFHCGCPIVKASLSAHFALVTAAGGVPSLGQFDPGSDAYPDRSTTMIVQVPDIDGGRPVRLTGPGIESEAMLRIAGVPLYFWQERHEQQEMFPCGIDLIFTCGTRLVALPRSTEIEV